MNFLELAKQRRSVRKFTEQELSPEQIQTLLEAAQATPSAGNCQPWHFFVIKDNTLKNKIQEISYKQSFIATAPVVFVICADYPKTMPRYGERGRDLYCLQDTAAAIQNIMLCATDLGLGSCWCGAFDETAMSELLKLSGDLRPIAVLPVGYPATVGNMPRRRSIDEIATFM